MTTTNNVLSADAIEALLRTDNGRDPRYPIPEHRGPLRRYEREMRCVSTFTSRNGRNCNSPTFHKVNGIPTCMMHALLVLNDMLVQLETPSPVGGEDGNSNEERD